VPHSLTGFAVEAGLLDEQEAVQHEQRHVIFNVVGAPDMRVDVATPVKLAPFDTVLLASDGLFDNLFVDEIVATAQCGPLPARMSQLIAQADERMRTEGRDQPSKPDDLTVILCRESRGRRRRRGRKKT
jgi:serine/threonine protein phosphatase PrpC